MVWTPELLKGLLFLKMTIEINHEALEALSVADLSNLITLLKLYPETLENATDIKYICTQELKRRVDNIFIF